MHAVTLNGAPGRFSTIDTTQTTVRGFDFTNMLTLPGEGIMGAAVWSILVLDGIDPTPGIRLIGSSSVAGNVTSQKIGGCVANVEYMLAATVSTTAGQIFTLWAEQYCVPAL